MSRSLATAALAALLALDALPARAASPGRDEASFTSCRDMNVQFDDQDTARGEHSLTASLRQVPELKVNPSENGGIRVQGVDGNEWSITACKVASGSGEAAARSRLEQVTVALRGGELATTGPEDGRWAVFFVIRAPRGGGLDLDATNGPVALRDVDGKVTIRCVNGPVSVRNGAGQLRVSAVNGPVTLTGARGDIRVDAENGPLTVRLEGDRWDGAGLVAHTENGPLTVRVPEGYSSGVKVTTSAHAPVRCRAAGCPDASGGARREQAIELGGSSPVVLLSTVNGPVSIDGSRNGS